jgi:N-acetylmuramoyl-L-alanine amidase
MSIHPGNRLVQIGLKSLGYDPGEADAWFGSKTKAAAQGLIDNRNPRGSAWAMRTLLRGLDDLGWYDGDIDDGWSEDAHTALVSWVVADGLPKAAYSADPEVANVPVSAAPETRAPTPAVRESGAKIVQGGTTVHTIMLHTTATPGDYLDRVTEDEAFRNIRSYHMAPTSKGGRGWSDIGYHGLIFWSGNYRQGRPFTRTGAGAYGWNNGVVHFSMFPVKTIKKLETPEYYYTPEQIATMRAMIEDVCTQTPIIRINGHQEVAQKLCPGFPVVDSYWTQRDVL